MKKVAALVIAVAFMMTAMPSFAQNAQAPAKENNLFKIIAGTLKPWNPKPKNQLKPFGKIEIDKKVNGFQNVANAINDGSKKAKAETLRTK